MEGRGTGAIGASESRLGERGAAAAVGTQVGGGRTRDA